MGFVEPATHVLLLFHDFLYFLLFICVVSHVYFYVSPSIFPFCQ